jgi:hypothetical protein
MESRSSVKWKPTGKSDPRWDRRRCRHLDLAPALVAADGAEYLRSLVASYPLFVLLLPIGAFGWWGASRGKWWPFASWAGLCLVAYPFYFAKVGGDFMEYRFSIRLLPTPVVFAGPGFGLAADRSAVPALVLVPGCCPLLETEVRLEKPFTGQSLHEMNRYADHAKAVGKAFRSALPADTVVATTLVGTVAFSDLRIVDQWGIADPVTAHKDVGRRFIRGHIKFADRQPLRAPSSL